jgi:hypothetical protein
MNTPDRSLVRFTMKGTASFAASSRTRSTAVFFLFFFSRFFMRPFCADLPLPSQTAGQAPISCLPAQAAVAPSDRST